MAKRIFDVSIHMNEMGSTKAGVPEENYLAIYPTDGHQLAITNSDGDINELYNATNIPVCSDETAGIAQVDGTTIIAVEGVLSTGSSVVINPMTAAGDLIVGGENGTASGLPAGDDGQVLMISDGSPAWMTAPSGGGVWTKLYTSTPTESDAASVEFTDIFNDDYTKYRVYFDVGCKLGAAQTTTTLLALAGPAGATPTYYTSDYSGCLYWNSNMGSTSTGVISSTMRSYNFSGYTNFMFQTLSSDQAQGVFSGYMEIQRTDSLFRGYSRWYRKTELLTYPVPNQGIATWYTAQPVSALKFYDSNANNTIMAGAQITVYGIQ